MDLLAFFKDVSSALFPFLEGLAAIVLLLVSMFVMEMIVTKFGIFHYRLVAGFKGKKRSDDFYLCVGCGAICVYTGLIVCFFVNFQ